MEFMVLRVRPVVWCANLMWIVFGLELRDGGVPNRLLITDIFD